MAIVNNFIRKPAIEEVHTIRAKFPFFAILICIYQSYRISGFIYSMLQSRLSMKDQLFTKKLAWNLSTLCV